VFRSRTRFRAYSLAASCLLLGVSSSALAGDAPSTIDPLNSPSWQYVQARYFDGQKLIFDDRIKVLAPTAAEDPLDVPIMVTSDGIADVEEVVVIADLNPIQKILAYQPKRASPDISFRFKVEQSTPVRAAMRTKDGVWHLGGTWLSAAGGGCTTPSGGSSGLWQGHLGEVNARIWPREDKNQRLRLRVIHPMDTGLAKGVPVFYIDQITLRDDSGAELATLQPFEPISENPVLSFDLKNVGPVHVEGHDIQGNTFTATIQP